MKPLLTRTLNSQEFKQYYYLKEELMNFCRQEGLQISGSKTDLNNRIVKYLDTGEKSTKKIESIKDSSITTCTSIISLPIAFNEEKRAFFKSHIGESFGFLVPFQQWLKNSPGKTYQEAIDAYYQILDDKKKNKTTIDKQFEYNTYIRDFFTNTTNKTLPQAIACWKYKKSLAGNTTFESSDLEVLEDDTRN